MFYSDLQGQVPSVLQTPASLPTCGVILGKKPLTTGSLGDIPDLNSSTTSALASSELTDMF
jgi:hypothetical protein